MAVPVPVVVTAAGAPEPVARRENWSAAATRPVLASAFCRLRRGALAVLVRLQVICAAARTLAAGMVTVVPANVPKLAGLPVTAALASVQLADVRVKLGSTVSRIGTWVLQAVTVMGVGVAGAGCECSLPGRVAPAVVDSLVVAVEDVATAAVLMPRQTVFQRSPLAVAALAGRPPLCAAGTHTSQPCQVVLHAEVAEASKKITGPASTAALVLPAYPEARGTGPSIVNRKGPFSDPRTIE